MQKRILKPYFLCVPHPQGLQGHIRRAFLFLGKQKGNAKCSWDTGILGAQAELRRHSRRRVCDKLRLTRYARPAAGPTAGLCVPPSLAGSEMSASPVRPGFLKARALSLQGEVLMPLFLVGSRNLYLQPHLHKHGASR